MIHFGTSGWRAIISDTFTFRNVRLVTQAIANVVLEAQGRSRPDGAARAGDEPPRVVVGYDTRFLSEKVAAETASVLSSNRVTALLCSRDAPTPAIALEILGRGAAGGIYFTASHNPPEYNGLKYYDARGAPAPTALTDRIELEVLKLENEGFDRRYLADDRFVTAIDPQESYLKHLLASVDIEQIRRAGLKLAIDPLFGTSREYLDRVLIENECQVEVIHNFADPYFGGYSPECSEKNLGELRRLVLESKADVGLATDGDGDRFGVLGSDGSFFPADDVVPLLIHYLASTRGLRGGVARTVATSHLVDKVAARHGLAVIETPVGFKYIADELLRGAAVVGGEESGGFTLISHMPEKDGVLACLLVAEMLAARGKPLAELKSELWAEHGPHYHRRLTFELTPDIEAALAEAVESAPREIEGQRVAEVRKTDGVKLVLGDASWCLIRRSGTEPALRIYAESATPLGLERLLHGAKRLVRIPR